MNLALAGSADVPTHRAFVLHTKAGVHLGGPIFRLWYTQWEAVKNNDRPQGHDAPFNMCAGSSKTTCMRSSTRWA
jgi:hypothetical protein